MATHGDWDRAVRHATGQLQWGCSDGDNLGVFAGEEAHGRTMTSSLLPSSSLPPVTITPLPRLRSSSFSSKTHDITKTQGQYGCLQILAMEDSDRPIRIMNFVSEEQLVEAKRSRGERVEDGTAQRDRPLYEILKENKDKRDAEFNERFKHRPPKALDEDETEFLENYEAAAVAAQSNIVHELKEKNPLDVVQVGQRIEEKSAGKRNPSPRPSGMIIKVTARAKKAKVDEGNAEEVSKAGTACVNDKSKSLEPVQSLNGEADKSHEVAQTGLVSYSDESDDDL
ncbi:hypothetical protein SESBI_35061 [Sesbania bispinosa]|nr:hypothetical protein SESBI_35061 [Sesbania bispinosa]